MHAQTQDGNTALSHACMSSAGRCVHLLLSNKADLRTMDNTKQSSLHKAAQVVSRAEQFCFRFGDRRSNKRFDWMEGCVVL